MNHREKEHQQNCNSHFAQMHDYLHTSVRAPLQSTGSRCDSMGRTTQAALGEGLAPDHKEFPIERKRGSGQRAFGYAEGNILVCPKKRLRKHEERKALLKYMPCPPVDGPL